MCLRADNERKDKDLTVAFEEGNENKGRELTVVSNEDDDSITNYVFKIPNNIYVGKKLFHINLGKISVTSMIENGFLAKTSTHGVLDFKYYDIGKVLFYEEYHFKKTFLSYTEYIDFYNKEQKEKEIDKKRLAKEKREERKRQQKDDQELERQKGIETGFKVVPNDNNKNDEELKIKKILKSRKIKELIHFTRMENLSSILNNGLVPVSMQGNRIIEPSHNDLQRIDSMLDCTSCSISFPNYKLFYSFRDCKYPGTKWVVIVLKTDLLFSQSNKVYFCYTNAAGLPRRTDYSTLTNAASLENMYCKNSINRYNNKTIDRSVLQISDNYTTDPQAEVLINGIISSKYISRICFNSKDQINQYIKMNGSVHMNKFDCDDKYFKPRNDYLFWQKGY